MQKPDTAVSGFMRYLSTTSAEPAMPDYFPFTVEVVDEAGHGAPEQLYQIHADFEEPHLAMYKALFERYGMQRGQFSLVDVTFAIIKGSTHAGLAEHLDFDEEGYLLDMHVDSEEALQQFATVVCPVYRRPEQLEQYVGEVIDDRPQRSQGFFGQLQQYIRRLTRL